MFSGFLDCYSMSPERNASTASRFLDRFVPNREAIWDPSDPTDVLGIRAGHGFTELLQFLELQRQAEYTMYFRNKESHQPGYAILAWCSDGSLILGLSTAGAGSSLLADLGSFTGSPGYCGGEEAPAATAAEFKSRLAAAGEDEWRDCEG